LAGNRLASPDYVASHKYFSAAAKHGHPVALFNLGIIYRLGLSVQSNCMLAVTLFKSAAERSDKVKTLVSDAYASVEQDPERSLLSYMVLAEIGLEIAQSNAAWVLESGINYTFPLFFILFKRTR
jgi:SEL1 protein